MDWYFEFLRFVIEVFGGGEGVLEIDKKVKEERLKKKKKRYLRLE